MELSKKEATFAAALLGSSLTSFALFFIGALFYEAQPLWFLNWNLFLAWVPLIASTALVHYLKKSRWLSGYGVILSFIWIFFIPNSFYLLTDLIHLSFYSGDNVIYYAVMLFSFAVNGMLLGYISLFQVHNELIKRFKSTTAHYLAGLVLLLCSYAIYLGRYLRWSSWDIVANPAGLLFDVSDQVVNPIAHGHVFQITIYIFILLGAFYWMIWQVMKVLSTSDK